jgi:NAD+ kinase
VEQQNRRVLVLSHAGHDDSRDAVIEVCRQLTAASVQPVLRDGELDDILAVAPDLSSVVLLDRDVALDSIESAVVLGGDGTILRAAELVRGSSVPLIGVNLGHVGFLAETEKNGLTDAIERVVARDYDVEERFTLSVRVKIGDEVVFDTWAINEATVEKASRSRILEVVVEVDRRPLSSFSCDGVVMATPTGSTAYAFSAGGPIVWPSVEAMVFVPISAHALFARPLVVGPESVMAVELRDRADASGILWCDGRRSFDLPAGARVVVKKSPVSVRLASLRTSTFTDRLVSKFDLPVDGWRGPGRS